MSEPGLTGLNDYQDSSRCPGETSRSSYNPVNRGSDTKIPCCLTSYILFIFIHCIIGRIMLIPQFHPPLVSEGEKFENLSTL
ncbi:MAG: hypothetical protein JSV88_34100 [Candidatus Aminicenantes bacterium]|nr:MAG: hypothetical protein JSV88_34100 [Candidatus Aminicenantes bacterium]